MKKFSTLYAQAAKQKGGEAELEALLPETLSAKKLGAIPDDRWLAMMTKCVFQAGFSWKVIDAKWPGFEAAFHGFDVGRCSMLSDADVDGLLKNKDIVRNGAKILSVPANASFLRGLAIVHGAAGKYFGQWPDDDFAGLLEILKKRGNRLGGMSGQYFLRFMGKDSFITSKDVTKALVREGVVAKQPASKRDLDAVQAAFNQWRRESGRTLAHVSRVLAATV